MDRCLKRLVSLVVVTFGLTVAAQAQNVPSTHSPGCGGLLCDGNDPPHARPPAPCTGLICGMTPYGMDRPVTAAEAQQLQAEPARAEPPVAATPARAVSKRKPKLVKAKAKTVIAKRSETDKPKAEKDVAAHTPDAAPAPAPAK